MRSLRQMLALLLILCALLSACTPISWLTEGEDARAQDWKPADLRLLDAIDSASSERDLIAAYMRLKDTDFQIRLDLLENADPLNYDLHIALDFMPGSGEALPFEPGPDFGWDVILNAPANHEPDVVVRDSLTLPQALPRVVRDSFLDCITLSIPANLLAGKHQVAAMAWIDRPDEAAILDLLGPFRLEGSAPPRAPLLLEFWNSLPARTPAQLLRRWDGAHTGPYGQRHGLRYLLLAAQSNRIPLTLLDLSQPESLRGLNLVNGLDLVQQLNNSGLLTLPEDGYSVPEFSAEMAEYNRRVASSLGIKTSHTAFGFSQEDVVHRPDAVYAALQDSTHIRQFDGIRFIPTLQSFRSREEPQTIDQNGLTTAAIRLLLDAAFSQDPADLVLLGGSLPESPWGDLTVARKTMQYIAGHPWIQALSGADLLIFPALKKQGLHEILACPEDALCAGERVAVPVLTPYGMAAASLIDSAELSRQLYQNILRLPSDPFADSAREMFAALTLPAADTRLAQFNASTLTQVGYLIAASRWNSLPTVEAQCSSDPDWDGYPECILSNETFFAILDPEGGRLAFAAARKKGQAFQLIGPTSQTAAGRDDPGDWLTGLGTLADPAEIPGAFADSPSEWAVYTAVPGENQIVFTDENRGITRTFTLNAGKFEITLQNDAGPHYLPVYLAIVANAELAPSAQLEIYSNQIRWPLSAKAAAELNIQGAEIESNHSVLEAIPSVRQSEDPNKSYPEGHYLPFPFLIVKLSSTANFSLTISIE